MDTDYDFDESSEKAPCRSESVADEVAAAPVHQQNEFPRVYLGYSTILREAEEYYGENRPPFAFKYQKEHDTGKEVVLAGPDGQPPLRITPDILHILTARPWGTWGTGRPRSAFRTIDYEGQRYIVKYLNNAYHRWLGLDQKFEDTRFLIPRQSCILPSSARSRPATSLLQPSIGEAPLTSCVPIERLSSQPSSGVEATGAVRKKAILDLISHAAFYQELHREKKHYLHQTRACPFLEKKDKSQRPMINQTGGQIPVLLADEDGQPTDERFLLRPRNWDSSFFYWVAATDPPDYRHRIVMRCTEGPYGDCYMPWYGHEHYEQGLEVTPFAYPLPDPGSNESDLEGVQDFHRSETQRTAVKQPQKSYHSSKRRRPLSSTSDDDRPLVSRTRQQTRRRLQNPAGQVDLNPPVPRPGALPRPRLLLPKLSAPIHSKSPNNKPKSANASSSRKHSAINLHLAADKSAPSGSVDLPRGSLSSRTRATTVDSVFSPALARSSVAEPTVPDGHTSHQLESIAGSQERLQSDINSLEMRERLLIRQLEVRDQQLQGYV
ncbi:MAG: hypothetical protein Q9224_004230 [Gallowayella concinna]